MRELPAGKSKGKIIRMLQRELDKVQVREKRLRAENKTLKIMLNRHGFHLKIEEKELSLGL